MKATRTTRPEVWDLPSAHSLLVVSQSLRGGGAERVITVLLRHLDRKRFKPSLVLFAREGPFLEDIPPDVQVYGLGERNPYNLLRTAARLRRVIREARPSVILSVLKHPNLLTLAVRQAFFRDIPVVLTERSILSLNLTSDRGRLLKRLLHRRLYPCAQRIIAVSSAVREDLERRFGLSGERIQVIPNPCDIERVQGLAREEPDLKFDRSIPTVVAVGRLTKVKGFSYLLQAFAAVARERGCRLLILGEGEERPALGRQAAELGIADRVLMPGFRRNPFAYMARSHVFVLSSLSEGFPNVIVEALACGIPVVSTSWPSGPGEPITDGVNGLLVPPANPGALAQGMARLLDDPSLRVRLSHAGRSRALEFSPSIIAPQYEAVLSEALGLGPRLDSAI